MKKWRVQITYLTPNRENWPILLEHHAATRAIAKQEVCMMLSCLYQVKERDILSIVVALVAQGELYVAV